MQFYFQNGRPAPIDIKEQCLFRINQGFYGHLDGLQIHGEISQKLMSHVSCLLWALTFLVLCQNLGQLQKKYASCHHFFPLLCSERSMLIALALCQGRFLLLLENAILACMIYILDLISVLCHLWFLNKYLNFVFLSIKKFSYAIGL